MNITIQFKSYQHTFDYITYGIEVKSDSETWTFDRRYSNMRQFYYQLPPILLIFPPKKFFGNKNPNFLAQRQKDLESFFQNLLKIPNILDFPVVKSYLFPSDKIIISQTKKEEKKVERQVNVEHDSKIVSQKVADGFHLKLFDLGSQPMPLEDEDYRIKEKVYRDLLRGFKVEKDKEKEIFKVLELDIGELSSSKWMVKTFDKLLGCFPEAAH